MRDYTRDTSAGGRGKNARIFSERRVAEGADERQSGEKGGRI